MKKHLLYLVVLFCIYSPSRAQQNVSIGSIKHILQFSSKFVDARNVDIWLPPGYQTDKKYPVLYMHDGQMLFDSTTSWNKQEWGVDEVLGQLIAKNQIEPLIVVGVFNSNQNRHIDYFPQKPFERLTKKVQDSLYDAVRPATGVGVFSKKIQSDLYLRFLVEELKPFIDSNFAVYTDAANTCIAGSSMGGLISLYAICEYPKVFGGAACLSTHWPGIFTVENNPIPNAFVDYMQHHLPNPDNHRIYFDYGTATLDALYEPFQLKADAVMRNKGFTEINWMTLKFEGANHSEKSWNARLHQPIQFLFKKK
ncbi:MAG: hypothetical protein RLY16_1350 [Bacteroidota bacterium]|jgi:enterochelin esterase-like enzyme